MSFYDSTDTIGVLKLAEESLKRTVDNILPIQLVYWNGEEEIVKNKPKVDSTDTIGVLKLKQCKYWI